MAGHTSEKRWAKGRFGDIGIGDQVKESATQMVFAMNMIEETYQDLLELWAFAGGTDQLVADQLFFEEWVIRVSDPVGAPGVVDTQANAVEVGKVADAKATMLALHQLYQGMTNEAVVTADRLALIRRMT